MITQKSLKGWLLSNENAGEPAFDQQSQPVAANTDLCILAGESPLSEYNFSTGEIAASTSLVLMQRFAVFFFLFNQPVEWKKKIATSTQKNTAQHFGLQSHAAGGGVMHVLSHHTAVHLLCGDVRE